MQEFKWREKYLKDKEINLVDNKGFKYYFFKRLIDIIVTVLGSILLLPIMLITAVAIKIDSKGPIIFSQSRVGIDGKIFKMYKFRSMVEDAENRLEELKDKNEMSGPVFKIKKDPRITRVGRIIRKTSIDELPQFYNVLKGEMSLVGPRPSLINEVENFEPWMLIRLMVKPGLTCYWQVGGRNNMDFQEWMKLDVKYIKERTLLLDIKLIFRTIILLLGDKNAS